MLEAPKGYHTALHAIEWLVAERGEEAVRRLVEKMRPGGDRASFAEAVGCSMEDFVRRFDAERKDR